MWQSSSISYHLELSSMLSLPMCLMNLICLMLLDWAFFKCFINLANHLWSIWVHFLSAYHQWSQRACTSPISYLPQTCKYHLWKFWMPCSNGDIALFIFIHHTLNNKWPFIWFWANCLNISHCHQLNVIRFKLLWCHRFFSCCTTSCWRKRYQRAPPHWPWALPHDLGTLTSLLNTPLWSRPRLP